MASSCDQKVFVEGFCGVFREEERSAEQGSDGCRAGHPEHRRAKIEMTAERAEHRYESVRFLEHPSTLYLLK